VGKRVKATFVSTAGKSGATGARCGKTFAARKGTTFDRLRTAQETVTVVVTLLAHGCPLQAIAVAFGLDERTVADWHARAAAPYQRVQPQLVEQPRQLGQVQADELCGELHLGD
jgi:transposase-like protein